MTRRLLFTADVPPERARRWAGAIAAIARDAAFSGWEEEAPLVPADPAEVADAIDDLASRYVAASSRSPGRGWSSSTTSTGSTRRARAWSTRSSGRHAARPLAIVIGTRPGPTPADATLAGVERLHLAGLDEAETARAGRRRRRRRARPVRRSPPPRADRRQPAVHHRDGPGDLRRRSGRPRTATSRPTGACPTMTTRSGRACR